MFKRKTTLGLLGLLVVSMLLSGCFGLFQKMVEVKGTVVNEATSKPLAGATVKLGDLQTKTNDKGAFSFEKVKPGPQKVTVAVDGETVYSKTEEIANKGPVILEIAIKEFGSVQGAVSSETGSVADARVTIGGKVVTTDEDGEFSIGAVEYGSHTLTVHISGVRVHSATVDVDAKQISLGDIVVPIPHPVAVAIDVVGLIVDPVPESAPAVAEGEGVSGIDLTRGPGLGLSGLTNGFSAADFATGDPSLAVAMEQGDYFQWGMTVEAGFRASLSEVSMSMRRSAANGPMNYVLQVSLDDFATDGITVAEFNYFGRTSGSRPSPDPLDEDPYYHMHSDLPGHANTATSPGDPIKPIDLSTVAELQDVEGGTSITFRLYGYGNDKTTNTNSVALGRMVGPQITGHAVVD